MQKKRIEKEDGRYLIYFHSAESANEDQKTAFENVEAKSEEVFLGTKFVTDREEK